MFIEGIIAKRFEDKKKINLIEKEDNKSKFVELLNLIRPEKDIAILGISGTFSSCESVEDFWQALLEVICFSIFAIVILLVVFLCILILRIDYEIYESVNYYLNSDTYFLRV